MSKVIIEAMACGLVVIASDILAHRQTILDGINGFICEGNSAAIRACLEKLLAMSPEVVCGILKHARHDVEECYSMRGNTRLEQDIYRHLLRTRRKQANALPEV